MVAILDDGEDFDCPICISSPTNIVITRCAHIYCKSCVLKTIRRGKPCCPLCRHDLSESDIFSPPQEESDNAKVVSSSKSSKISAFFKLLSASRDQDPTAKSVIFPQFRKMLILLEEPLKNAGFKVLRLDGSMNTKKRAQVIKDFGVPAPNGPTVLLASLKASGTGVNLAAANKVYLVEPWWNPAVDEQAMDRVHRIGQTKEVTIVRIIARNSIEERILELQDKKKRMATKALDRKAGPAERKINIDDIRTLVSLYFIIGGCSWYIGPNGSVKSLHPAVEEEAMDTVNWIGQTKKVTVVRIIARNMIEKPILELHDKNKRMASKGLHRKAGQTDPKMKLDDIRTLVSL